VNHLLEQFQIRRCFEWPVAGQHLIQHHAERKHVAARVQRLAAGLLRRHVCDGADDDSLLRLFFGDCPCNIRGLGCISSLAKPKSASLA
jgi:hypothetical protein